MSRGEIKPTGNGRNCRPKIHTCVAGKENANKTTKPSPMKLWPHNRPLGELGNLQPGAWPIQCLEQAAYMQKIVINIVMRICGATSILLLGAGCAWNSANYNRATTRFVSGSDTNAIPGYGSISVWHHHGMMRFSPDGPQFHTDSYTIFFKQATNSSNDFYMSLSKDLVPVEITESKGVVMVEGHSVLVNVEYRDASGRWIRPPINGRHKIRFIYPDDLRRSTNSPHAP
jgi:hypothetical protein